MQPKDNQSLRVLHAKWILEEIPTDGVPDICQQLIADGLDSPSLRYLAGLMKVELYQVPGLMTRMFSEFKMEECSKIEAAWFLVKDFAAQVQSGRMGAYEGSYRIGQIGNDCAPIFPYVRTFVGASAEWDEYPEHSQELESKIRTAAAALVLMPAPPAPGKGSEVDRLVKIANNQRVQGLKYDKTEAANTLTKAIPAGHVMNGANDRTWIAIGSQHDMLIAILHVGLPFAIVRWEFEKFIQQPATRLGLLITNVPSADMAVLSLTGETINLLAGRNVELPSPLPWLSVDDLLRLT